MSSGSENDEFGGLFDSCGEEEDAGGAGGAADRSADVGIDGGNENKEAGDAADGSDGGSEDAGGAADWNWSEDGWSDLDPMEGYRLYQETIDWDAEDRDLWVRSLFLHDLVPSIICCHFVLFHLTVDGTERGEGE